MPCIISINASINIFVIDNVWFDFENPSHLLTPFSFSFALGLFVAFRYPKLRTWPQHNLFSSSLLLYQTPLFNKISFLLPLFSSSYSLSYIQRKTSSNISPFTIEPEEQTKARNFNTSFYTIIQTSISLLTYIFYKTINTNLKHFKTITAV